MERNYVFTTLSEFKIIIIITITKRQCLDEYLEISKNKRTTVKNIPLHFELPITAVDMFQMKILE